MAGTTIANLANGFDLHKTTTVSAILDRKGVARRNLRISEKDVQLAIELYERGESLVRVAARVGCSPASVANHLRNNDVQLRARRGWTL